MIPLKQIGDLFEQTSAPPRDARAMESIRIFLELLEKWNLRVNLTASTDWNDIEPLLGEALWAASRIPDRPHSVLDLGSGAGFPALVFKILKPELRLTLVESRYKRAAFLDSAVNALELEHTRVYQGRIQSFLSSPEESSALGTFDVVTWKGIVLNKREALLLKQRLRPGAELWLFHGSRIPVEGSSLDELALGQSDRLPFPLRLNSYLTIVKLQ